MVWLCGTFGEFFVWFTKYNPVIHASSHPWRTSLKLNHLVVNGWVLFMLIVIPRLLSCWSSLDVVRSWMTTKDGWTLIDPHQLSPRPCVVHVIVAYNDDFYLFINFLFNIGLTWALLLMLTCGAISRLTLLRRFVLQKKRDMASFGWLRRFSDRGCHL